ncbi:MAG: hypothetical protein KJ626_12585 [Verrucomicrobia bacterium]|nr:hypothetical protein [Verrucomicrobiota bacterium]
MTLAEIHHVLQWTTLINVLILMFWAVLFMCARGFVYRLHSRWFKISEETFYAIHYAGIVVFKMIVFVFNVVPLLALYIIR